MFSTGQLIFAAIFFVVFVAVIVYSYRRDIKLHRKYYKGTIYVFVAFILFMVLLFVLKTQLRY